MFGWYKKLKNKVLYSYIDNVVNSEANLPPLPKPEPEHVAEVVVDNKIEEILLAGPINDVPKVFEPEPDPEPQAEEIKPDDEKPTPPKKKAPGRPKGSGSTTKSTTKKLPPKA